MENAFIDQVRRFNRAVTQRIGALDESYLARGRPLGEARLLFEVGAAGHRLDVKSLRAKLGLDSGYLSRLLRSLQKQGLIDVDRSGADGRVRDVALTTSGVREYQAYDRLSDELAVSILNPLGAAQREQLVLAMAQVERLLQAAPVEIKVEPADSADARHCLSAYYAELAQRFEAGFDPDAGNLFDPAEMTPPHGWFVVARHEGGAVGCGALKTLEPGIGEIKRVWTAAEARGRGVAWAIMDKLEGIAVEAGMTVLRLDTNKVLTEAHALYRKLGYHEIGRYNDNPYAHHWFEKAL